MTDAALRPDPTPRLRLRSPGDIPAAIPYLLGFHPSESIVLIAVRGSRRRVTCTLRWDLPLVRTRRDRDRAVDEILSRLALVGGDAAILAVYAGALTRPAGGDAALPLAHLVAAVEQAGVPLLQAVCVRDGRWWSYLCADPRCCPPEGTPLVAAADPGGPTEIAAAAAVAGLAVLCSREDLVAALRPVGGAARTSMDRALDREEAELETRVTRGASAEDIRAESIRLFRAAVRRFADPPASLDAAEAARLLLGVLDVQVRDEVMLWTDGPRTDVDALRSLLPDLVRRATPAVVAAPATMLAWVAYRQGDGAFARIALDRALSADPGYRLALFLDAALTHAVPPASLRQPRSGARSDGGQRRRRS